GDLLARWLPQRALGGRYHTRRPPGPERGVAPTDLSRSLCVDPGLPLFGPYPTAIGAGSGSSKAAVLSAHWSSTRPASRATRFGSKDWASVRRSLSISTSTNRFSCTNTDSKLTRPFRR